MDLDNLISVIGGAIGAGAVSKWVERWMKRKDRRDNINTLRDFSYINSSLNDILENTSVRQVLIMQTHNGGQVIKPTSKLFTSCLYERCEEPYHPVKPHLQNTLMSSGEIELVLASMEGEYGASRTSELADPIIKAYLEKTPTKLSTFHGVYNVKKMKVFYMVCATNEDIDNFSHADIFTIQKNCRIIEKVMDRYE